MSNTLWIAHCAHAAKRGIDSDALAYMLRSVLASQPDVAFIAGVLPPGVDPYTPLWGDLLQVQAPSAGSASVGSLIEGPGAGPLRAGSRLGLLASTTLIPRLSMRMAAVEDHDDLIPVFDAHSEVVSADVGEFFLAELIEGQAQGSHSIVGTVGNTAVGLMAASSAVDLPTLQGAFHLEAFNGLQRRTVAQARVEAAAARDAGRASHDWLAFLTTHAAEVAALFDAITAPSAAGGGLGAVRAAAAAAASASASSLDTGAVPLSTVMSALDVRGRAWGYAHPGGVGLGTAMVADMLASSALPSLKGTTSVTAAAASAVTRASMNAAVATVSAARERRRRQRRLAEVTASREVGGMDALRDLVLGEFDTLQSSIAQERSLAAGAAREAAQRAAAEARAAFEAQEAERRERDGFVGGVGLGALEGEGGVSADAFPPAPAPGATSPSGSVAGSEEGVQVDLESVRVPVLELAASVSAAVSEAGVAYTGEAPDVGAGEELVLELACVLGRAGWGTVLAAHLDDEASLPGDGERMVTRDSSGDGGEAGGEGSAGGGAGGSLAPSASTASLELPQQAIHGDHTTDRLLLEVALDRLEGVLSIATVASSSAADAVVMAGAEDALLKGVEGLASAPGQGALLGSVVSARATRLAIARAEGVPPEQEAVAGALLSAALGVPVVHLPTVVAKVTAQLQAEAVDATEKASVAEEKRRVEEAKRRKRRMRLAPKHEDSDEEDEEDEAAAAAAAAEAAAAEAALYKGQYAGVVSVLASPLCSRGYILTGLPGPGSAPVDTAELRVGLDKVTALLLEEMELPVPLAGGGGAAAQGAAAPISGVGVGLVLEEEEDEEEYEDPAVRADGSTIPLTTGTLIPQALLLLDAPTISPTGEAAPRAIPSFAQDLGSGLLLRVTLPAEAAGLQPQVSPGSAPTSAAAAAAEQGEGGDGGAGGEEAAPRQGFTMLRAAAAAPSGLTLTYFGAEDAPAEEPSPPRLPPLAKRGVEVEVDLSVTGLGSVVAGIVPEQVALLTETAEAEAEAEAAEAAARAAAGKRPKRAPVPVEGEEAPPVPPHKSVPFSLLDPAGTAGVSVSVEFIPDIVTGFQDTAGPRRTHAAAASLVHTREVLLAALVREGLVSEARLEVADARRLAAAERSGRAGSTALADPVNAEEAAFDDALVEGDGVPDAFAITMFCLQEALESRAADFLPAIFALFPNSSYAVLTQPHAAPESPLLQFFTRVPPRTTSTLPHVLYVMHRCALGAPHTLSLRPVAAADRLALADFASQLSPATFVSVMSDAVAATERREALLAAAPQDQPPPLMSTLAASASPTTLLVEVEGQVVGVVSLSTAGCGAPELTAAGAAFDLQRYLATDQYVAGGARLADGVPPATGGTWRALNHLELNPLFSSPCALRAVMRRAMALTGASALLYRHWGAAVSGAVGVSALPPAADPAAAASTAAGAISRGAAAGAAGDTDPLPQAVRDMVLVPPRSMPQQRPHELPGAPPRDAGLPITSAISREVAGVALGRKGVKPLRGTEGGAGSRATPLPPTLAMHGSALDPEDEAAVQDREARMAALRARGFGYVDAMTGALPGGGGARDETCTDLSNPQELVHSLYVTTRRFLAEPKAISNTRIVVVGASEAGLAFLTALLKVPYLRFTHVSLVSPGGLAPPPTPPAMRPPQRGEEWAPTLQLQHGSLPLRAAPFLPQSTEFNPATMARLGLPSNVQVVDAAMVGIDRPAGRIHLAGGGCIPYDILMLAPGLTESTTGRLGLARPPRGLYPLTHAGCLAEVEEAVRLLVHRVPFPDAAEATAAALLPAGEEDESGAGAVVEGEDFRPPLSGIAAGRDVVVVGEGLEALVSIAALLHRGVAPSRISYVRRHRTLHALRAGAAAGSAGMGFGSGAGPTEAVEAGYVENLAAASLAALGVQQLVGWELSSVEEGEGGDAPGTPPPLTLRFTTTLDAEGVAAEAALATAAAGLTGEEEDSQADKEEEEEDDGLGDLGGFSLDAEEGKGGEGAGASGPRAPQSMALDARLVIAGDKRAVEAGFFNAVNDCGLVYDGRLVVNHYFCTTDGSIFAGGTVTKFSRRYRAPLPMQAYNSAEVGAAAAACVLKLVDPLARAEAEAAGEELVLAGPENTDARGSHMLPEFQAAKVLSAVLPGGLHWLHARLPAYEPGTVGRTMHTATLPAMLPSLPAEALEAPLGEAEVLAAALAGDITVPPASAAAEAMSLATAGAPAVAGLPAEAGAAAHVPALALEAVLGELPPFKPVGSTVGWRMAVTLDRFKRLSEVNHIGAQRIEVRNIASLVGRHASLLNAAERDFDDGRVSDWVAFFRQDWAVAAVHDRFGQLIQSLRKSLLRHPQVAAMVQSVGQLVRGMQGSADAKGDAAVERLCRKEVGTAGAALPAEVRAEVEAALIAFLKANRPLLPTFLLPGHVAAPTVDGKPATSAVPAPKIPTEE